MKKYYVSLRPFKMGIKYNNEIVTFPDVLGIGCVGLCPVFESLEDLKKYQGNDDTYVTFEAELVKKETEIKEMK